VGISWYPGHMNKARKELAKVMPTVDMVLELLDARTPMASANPLLAELRGELPCVTILTKADLAVEPITRQWQTFLSQGTNGTCLINGLDCQLSKETLLATFKRMVPKKTALSASHQILITGIPNVGKSSFLNQVLSRKLAKTGNEPAVTKGQQRVRLDDGWYLIDTPGMMWPKLTDQEGAFRLASTGTIRNTAIDAEEVAWFLAEKLIAEFLPQIEARYKLSGKPATTEDFFNQVAKNHGAINQGGRTDWQKVSDVLLNDFRSGRLGRFSLEQPPSRPAEIDIKSTK
jgi:ribosome biogenesis GTPase A